jgi:serine/threonine-protein kinase TTK/MPS1
MSRAHSEPSIKYQVKVNDKTYKVLRKIGSGGSAKVYEGFEPSTYQSVAIKIINVGMADPRTQASYFNEKAILSQMKDSKHVVKIFNSEYKSEIKELVIVMEKGDADLSQVLDYHFKSREHPGVLDGIFIKFYWRGMLQAVDEIHRKGIVHSDLKPVNFILVKNQIKLIDFGIASTLAPGGTSIIRDYQIGTINYMAPETLRNRALEASFHPMSFNDENNQGPPHQLQSAKKKTLIKYDTKADIWSLGCILYNFVYGRPPFDKYSDIISKVQAITNPGHVIDFPQINNIDLMNCMKMCLRHSPVDRPTAEQLLNHDYLRSDLVTVSRHNKSLVE